MNNIPSHLPKGIALLSIGLSLTLAVALTAFHIARANPGVLYAAPTAQGSADCSSWDNTCTVQTALSGATTGDEIWVRAGVHYPGSMITDTFTLQSGVALYGGFAGTENARGQRDWAANVTVLSGDIDQNDLTDPTGVVTDTANITGTNSYHVVTSGGVTETAMLDGFVITAGQANGDGGGMHNSFSTPTLNNVTFSANSAGSYGSGMYNYYSSPTLENVAINSNSANNGGGMYNYRSNPTLINVTFSGNTGVEYGGGMTNWESSPTLTGITFSGNTVSGGGGGMYNYQSSAMLTDVAFSGNSALYGGGGMSNLGSNPTLTNVTFSSNMASNGGGMFNEGESPTLTNVTFSENTAGDNGGGMFNTYSNPTLTNVAFNDNSAGEAGGGMHNSYASPILTYVAFSSNAAFHGGGMSNVYGSPTLMNVTFSGNSADEDGGGMRNFYTTPTLTDVTFGSNTAKHGGGMYVFGGNSALTNVTFSGNSAGLGGGMYNMQSSPMLTNMTFNNNSAGSGGGMYNWDSNTTLSNVVFSDNFAAIQGGGIDSYYGHLTLTNITFSGNSATQGGGMGNWFIYLTLTNVTFSGNFASNDGGGMYNKGDVSTLTNVVFSGNSAGLNGGGMYTQITYPGSSQTLTNVTFSENSANFGGGMYNWDNNPMLTNVILWGNTAPNGAGIYNDNISMPQISNSDIQGCGDSGSWDSACGVDGGGNIEADPLFVNPANDDLRLHDNSPAIDAGDSAALPLDTLTDLDGNPRFVDIPAVPDTGSGAGPMVDMGAYEVQYVDVVYVSLTTAGNVNGLSVADEDVIGYDIARDLWYLVFDGSDVGLGVADVDAFSVRPDGSLLLSLNAPLVIGDLGAVDDSDILRFIPTSLGMATSGAFELFWDGSAYGLTDDSEDVDALAFVPDGRLLVSTIGKLTVAGLRAQDEDLSALDLTTGTWSPYFDGSDVGLAEANSEDVYGAAVNGATGAIYLTTLGLFDVPGVSGDGADVLLCTSTSLGSTTSCAYTLFWDGSARGLAGETLDALEVGFSTGPMLWASAQTQQAAGVNDEDIFAYDPTLGVYAMVFDGSDVGLTADVNAFSRLADDSLLLSLDTAIDIPGLGMVDDSDILRFVPETLGLTTAGELELYFDGSVYGLTEDGEDIDALALAPDGRLLVSTVGNLVVSGLTAQDEDLSALDLATGSWSLYFDGSDVGLSQATSEDVVGAWVNEDASQVYVTTLGLFDVPGVSGDGTDVLLCSVTSLGNTTACTYSLYWDGSAHGVTAVLDGLELIQP